MHLGWNATEGCFIPATQRKNKSQINSMKETVKTRLRKGRWNCLGTQVELGMKNF